MPRHCLYTDRQRSVKNDRPQFVNLFTPQVTTTLASAFASPERLKPCGITNKSNKEAALGPW